MSVYTFYQLPDNDDNLIFRCEIEKNTDMLKIIEAFYMDAIIHNEIDEKLAIFHIINHEKKSTKNYIMAPSIDDKYEKLQNDINKCNELIEGNPIMEFQVKIENGILCSRKREV